MRSQPAASSRFIWNSGDVISHPSPAATASRWISRPGAGTSSGVSTSRKSRAAKNARTAASARARSASAARRGLGNRMTSVPGAGYGGPS